jgi:hypothetical protein
MAKDTRVKPEAAAPSPEGAQAPAPPPADTVTIPAGELRQLLDRLERLEYSERLRQARNDPNAKILDPDWDAHKIEASRPAAERTQDIADRIHAGPHRYQCCFDASESDKPNVRIHEHPAIIIRANSPEEAEVRWLRLIGVRKHDYKVKVTPID